MYPIALVGDQSHPLPNIPIILYRQYEIHNNWYARLQCHPSTSRQV